jgi:hypothetical protein
MKRDSVAALRAFEIPIASGSSEQLTILDHLPIS